jgi:hypothetical protein
MLSREQGHDVVGDLIERGVRHVGFENESIAVHRAHDDDGVRLVLFGFGINRNSPDPILPSGPC